MSKVKIALIGAGSMGKWHCGHIKDIPELELVAVCDVNKKAVKEFAAEFSCEGFDDYKKLFKAGIADAVLIVTPHYSHTTIGAAALKAGVHVLVEKPISVHKADCEKLIAAHTKRKQVFAAMFNQRTDPMYRKIKQLIDDGELGKLQRINWTVTNWFRTNAYYKSGSWRATWKGEGGGVLLNQCPHQLDLFQWLFGMPTKVTAFCGIGKYHKIEVEDEVTAYMEFKNGATGTFITSTGEAPGTNRLEIAGDNGKVVAEDGKLKFTKNEMPTSKFCKTAKQGFGNPPIWNIDIPLPSGNGGQHKEILENFAAAILKGKKLIAPAKEGIRSVELGNAMLLSSLAGKTIEMPMDGKAYARKLKQLIRESKK